MKKIILFKVCLLLLTTLKSQWVKDIKNNDGIGDPRPIVYAVDEEIKSILKLDQTEGIRMSITNEYLKDSIHSVTLKFLSKQQTVKYTITPIVRLKNSTELVLVSNLLSWKNVEMLDDFENSTSLLVEIKTSKTLYDFRFNKLTNTRKYINFITPYTYKTPVNLY